MTESDIKKFDKNRLIQAYVLAIKTKYSMNSNFRDKDIKLMEIEMLSRMVK